MDIVKEYPRAIATVLAGIICQILLGTALAPYIDENFNLALQTILGVVIAILFGRFTRLSKTEAEKLKAQESEDNGSSDE